jgi:hypothetical protein
MPYFSHAVQLSLPGLDTCVFSRWSSWYEDILEGRRPEALFNEDWYRMLEAWKNYAPTDPGMAVQWGKVHGLAVKSSSGGLRTQWNGVILPPLHWDAVARFESTGALLPLLFMFYFWEAKLPGIADKIRQHIERSAQRTFPDAIRSFGYHASLNESFWQRVFSYRALPETHCSEARAWVAALFDWCCVQQGVAPLPLAERRVFDYSSGKPRTLRPWLRALSHALTLLPTSWIQALERQQREVDDQPINAWIVQQFKALQLVADAHDVSWDDVVDDWLDCVGKYQSNRMVELVGYWQQAFPEDDIWWRFADRDQSSNVAMCRFVLSQHTVSYQQGSHEIPYVCAWHGWVDVSSSASPSTDLPLSTERALQWANPSHPAWSLYLKRHALLWDSSNQLNPLPIHVALLVDMYGPVQDSRGFRRALRTFHRMHGEKGIASISLSELF